MQLLGSRQKSRCGQFALPRGRCAQLVTLLRDVLVALMRDSKELEMLQVTTTAPYPWRRSLLTARRTCPAC